MFDEVLGQQSAKTQLTQLISALRIPHGLLFVGPRRVGKYTAARAFIRKINCRGVGDTACLCSPCRKLQQNSHPDVQLISVNDKQSIAVDQIRYLINQFAYCVNESPRKFAVIKNADLMNVQSANALLKLLEEPQGNTSIILTTDKTNNLLPTILSRTMPIRFAYLNDATLADISLKDESLLDPVQIAMMAGSYQPELVTTDITHLAFIWNATETELPDKIEPEVIRKELIYLANIFVYLLRTGQFAYKIVHINRANSERLTKCFNITAQAITYIEKGVKPFLVVYWYASKLREVL